MHHTGPHFTLLVCDLDSTMLLKYIEITSEVCPCFLTTQIRFHFFDQVNAVPCEKIGHALSDKAF